MFRRNYIEYDNTNSMWNNGHIYVYKNKKIVKSIFVDDFLENADDEDICGVDDIIDMLKQKYNIKKVKYKEFNWR